MSATRLEVVQMAQSFIGTPFHHRGRLPGVGLDCAGMVICAARELGLVAPDFDVPPYTRNPDGRSFLAWCDLHMRRVPQESMQAGDAIVFIVDVLPQHIGILGNYRKGGFSIIHAAMRAHPPRVIETRLMFSRVQRFVAAYRLPGVT